MTVGSMADVIRTFFPVSFSRLATRSWFCFGVSATGCDGSINDIGLGLGQRAKFSNDFVNQLFASLPDEKLEKVQCCPGRPIAEGLSRNQGLALLADERLQEHCAQVRDLSNEALNQKHILLDCVQDSVAMRDPEQSRGISLRDTRVLH
jgi:hypothetical protein